MINQTSPDDKLSGDLGHWIHMGDVFTQSTRTTPKNDGPNFLLARKIDHANSNQFLTKKILSENSRSEKAAGMISQDLAVKYLEDYGFRFQDSYIHAAWYHYMWTLPTPAACVIATKHNNLTELYSDGDWTMFINPRTPKAGAARGAYRILENDQSTVSQSGKMAANYHARKKRRSTLLRIFGVGLVSALIGSIVGGGGFAFNLSVVAVIGGFLMALGFALVGFALHEGERDYT